MIYLIYLIGPMCERFGFRLRNKMVAHRVATLRTTLHQNTNTFVHQHLIEKSLYFLTECFLFPPTVAHLLVITDFASELNACQIGTRAVRSATEETLNLGQVQFPVLIIM